MKYNFLLIFLLGISLFSNSQNYKCYDGYFCDNGYIAEKKVVKFISDSIYETYENLHDIPEIIESFDIWNVTYNQDFVIFTVTYWTNPIVEWELFNNPIDTVLSMHKPDQKKVFSVEIAKIDHKDVTMTNGFISRIGKTYFKSIKNLTEITTNCIQEIKLKRDSHYMFLLKNENNSYALLFEIVTNENRVKELFKLPRNYYFDE